MSLKDARIWIAIVFFGLGIISTVFFYFHGHIGVLDASLKGFSLVSLSPFFTDSTVIEAFASWLFLESIGVAYFSFLTYCFFYKKIHPKITLFTILSASLLIQMASVLALYFVLPAPMKEGGVFIDYLSLCTSAFFGSGMANESSVFSDFKEMSYLGNWVIFFLCWIGTLGFATLHDFFSPEKLRERLRCPAKRIEKQSAMFLWTSILLVSISSALAFFEIQTDESFFGKTSIAVYEAIGNMGLWRASSEMSVSAFFPLIFTSALPVIMSGALRKNWKQLTRWCYALLIGTIVLTGLCHLLDPHSNLIDQAQMILRGWLGAGQFETEALSPEAKIILLFSLIIGRLATFAAIVKIRTN